MKLDPDRHKLSGSDRSQMIVICMGIQDGIQVFYTDATGTVPAVLAVISYFSVLIQPGPPET